MARASAGVREFRKRFLAEMPHLPESAIKWDGENVDYFDTFMWPKKKTLAPTVAALIAHPAARMLRHVHLRAMDVPDLAPIGALKNLRELYLWHCKTVGSLAPLAKLGKLERFDVTHSGVSDLKPLATCKKLWFVSIERTSVSSLRPLHRLPALWEVWCEKANVSAKEAQALRVAMGMRPRRKRPNGGMDDRDVYGA